MDTMKQLMIVACLIVVLAEGLMPAGVRAQEPFSSRVRQHFAEAIFSSTDADGIVTEAYVFGNDDRSLPTGSFAYVNILRYDPNCVPSEEQPCPFLTNIEGSGDIGPDAFVIEGHLASARLSATIDAYDYLTDSPRTLEVNVSWSGTSDVYKSNAHFHDQTPAYTLNRHFNGAEREAVAEGAIWDGASNLTLEPTANAAILSLKFGQVVVS
jgi:hypothetical protein